MEDEQPEQRKPSKRQKPPAQETRHRMKWNQMESNGIKMKRIEYLGQCYPILIVFL